MELTWWSHHKQLKLNGGEPISDDHGKYSSELGDLTMVFH